MEYSIDSSLGSCPFVWLPVDNFLNFSFVRRRFLPLKEKIWTSSSHLSNFLARNKSPRSNLKKKTRKQKMLHIFTVTWSCYHHHSKNIMFAIILLCRIDRKYNFHLINKRNLFYFYDCGRKLRFFVKKP